MKKWIALLLVAVTMLSLWGCQKADEPAPENESLADLTQEPAAEPEPIPEQEPTPVPEPEPEPAHKAV